MTRIWKTTGILILTATLGSGCGHSVQRAEYPPEANPQTELATLERQTQTAKTAQVDVLAPSEFKKSKEHLAKARERLRKEARRDVIFKDLGYSRAYLIRANELADERRPGVIAALDARMTAIRAGSREIPAQAQELEKIDKQLADLADDETIHPEKFARIQQAYADLELSTIQSKQLGDVGSIIEGAKRDKAEQRAPRTLKQAEMSHALAMNAIAIHRRNPDGFSMPVARATDDAALLQAVLDEQRTTNWRISEDVALDLVDQKRSIASLDAQLSAERTQAETRAEQIRHQQSLIQSQRRQLAEREGRLADAMAVRKMNEALEDARRLFMPDEAEVFRQGDRLLIRLKGMHFPVGRAEIPPSSQQMLDKVLEITDRFEPTSVIVEGHTDATGGPDINRRLSQERAVGVAQYLVNGGVDGEIVEAVGHGYERPIASNRTPDGRAQNRRVDIWISATPQ